ncbi:unnamed protein product [Polarella glacialis]|uniref:Acyltransferase 3 domain-containing protein n=1 Tax=Polarella glacialis TaxID=89957 RepID=A0A813I751_POLGL|nr:unnamed protein product [Polarella glacialis]CAE8646056.1 unnamed protein product [Polarella glacialis]CAE8646360.1 unnamed protein product [Polarella glacialis]
MMHFFFLTMGFVSYWGNWQDRISLGAACSDLARRLGRLCPGYHLALLWLYALGANRQDPLAYPLQALFLQTLLPIKACGLAYIWDGANGEGWFVSAAVVCAVYFPMLYNARPRRGWQATTMVLLAVLTLCASTRWLRSHSGLYVEGLDVYVWAPPRVLEFSAGMLFAQLADELPEHLKSWPGWRYISDLCLGLAFVVVAATDNWFSLLAEDWFLTPLFGLHALSCSLTECSLERPEKSGSLQRGYLDTLLSSHLLVDAAQYSFGAYILQRPVRCSLTYLLRCLSPETLPAASWIMNLAGCWIAGMALTKFVENPLARVITSQLNARA